MDKVLTKVQLLHPARRALSSDWFVNSFIMVVYKKKKISHALENNSDLTKESHRQPL